MVGYGRIFVKKLSFFKKDITFLLFSNSIFWIPLEFASDILDIIQNKRCHLRKTKIEDAF